MSLTPEQAEQRIKTLPKAILAWGVRTLRKHSVVWGAIASNQYLQEAGLGAGPRPPGGGLLRSLSGRFRAGLIQARYRGRQEGFAKIVATRRRVSLLKTSRVPYFLVHELGYEGIRSDGRFMSIPARPTLGPALKDSMPALRQLAELTLARAIVQHMTGQPPSG